MPPAGEQPYTVSRGLIIAIIIAFILITAAGLLYYQSQEELIKGQVNGDLTTIASLKTGQIAAWREDRLYDARVLSSSAFLIDGIDHYLNYGDDNSRDMIRERFRVMKHSPLYDNVLLVDPQGYVRLSLDPAVTSIEPQVLTQVNRSLASGEAAMTDFHRLPGSGKIRLDVIAPLAVMTEGSVRPVGAVVFSINPDDYLYPLVQSWPVPSDSAETLLVKREGDHVLFLNDLRHQDNTALNLTIPLSQADLPAVGAVTGATGAFIGRDYRGVEVLSVLEPVPGSPWFMVAKIDTAEAYSGWRSRSGLIIALVAGVLASAVIILGFIWQRRQKYYYRTLYSAEAEKGRAREQYRELFEGVSIGIIRSTPGPRGTIIEVNRAVIRIFEAGSREQLLSVSPSDLYADPDQRRRVSDEILARGAITGMEVRYRTLRGKPFWGRITAVRKTAADGSVYFDNTLEDITDRRLAEDSLRQSEERFRTTLDALVEGCQIIGYDWKYLYVNDAVCRQGHKKREELLGRTMMEAYPGIDTTPLFPLLRHCMDERVGDHTENEFVYPDGTGGIFDLIIEPAPEGIFIFSMDITDRKEAEVLLRESEEKYRQLFENITAAFALHEVILDETGKPVDYRFLIVNEVFEKMTGLSGADIINRTVLDVLPGTEPYWIETYGEVAISGEPRLFENYSNVLKKWYEVRVYSPQRGQFATVFTDITNRRENERQREMLIKELERKNAELERFTYTVSHDLKSPIITIKGFAGLIEDDARKGDPVQLKKDIQRIIAAAETMQELLADVLELSRIGRVVSPPEKTSFGTIAHEAVELLAGPLAERGVTVEIAPDLPVVNVDHARVREVTTNLLENAIKFMGDQPVPVVRIGVETGGPEPVFFVADNGIGIDPRYLERVFNLFERLDVSTHGTGIGLTIVRRIIEVHGGKIWAESEGVGKGTTFRFTLPLADRDPQKND